MKSKTLVLLLGLICFSWSFIVKDDEACGWVGYCPIDSAGSTPICGVTGE